MAKRIAQPKTPAVSPLDPELMRRVVVEHVRPEIDCGRFPIKRVVGETVSVVADIHADGHDALAAALLYRRCGEEAWQETPMTLVTNDEWTAAFRVDALGRYEYTIEAWIDRFATWRHALSVKFGAEQDVSADLLEGIELVREVREVREVPEGEDDGDVLRKADILGDSAISVAERVTVALDARLQRVMAARADRSRGTRYDHVLDVIVDRERARFGAWYEMFPRSAGPDPTRSATFGEAAALLPYVASMGFDVLYLPPIHPIGRSFRKGRNNSLNPAPGDPGSPWAIGAEEGGHTAVEPGLGTLKDFDRFVAAARRQRLEIALDIAFQASPDHPYVREHPEWFRHRRDGTIKYAENPPKKYQDIYPMDFESAGWQELWQELKRVIEFWIGHGVKIFRVDNPHTKPYRFWHWTLGEIKRNHSDTIFLSEAFTRPKVMRYLAKAGFSQSYTYFTWRNTKEELTEHFTELTQTEVREYMRANLFANTPDILHVYLQRGGRPAFKIRFVLAATLGASYGIYSGFELCENEPVKPGSEEYLDSEKYQFKPRKFDQPSSLAEWIGRINAIRRAHPALQRDWGLAFQQTDNPQLLCYSKESEDGTDRLLMVVNLDPEHMQHGFVRLPLTQWGLTPEVTIQVEDLLSGERYFWRGEWNYVRLDPESNTAHILKVTGAPAPAPSGDQVIG
ncbi:MAG: alpha-1,4-glucan--maltose-1-phosphate maltosyltransferase [Acidobacteria bacterium]|nr:alpha-1,4-glucan--maltose-1-phosphate maltosyltransferase [Acidobacteriota bacterium]MCA1649072.1 alpha-1,4-glucan--maltose-1-phosphate maltosyltransferase [Acidobacteriota bacterium]